MATGAENAGIYLVVSVCAVMSGAFSDCPSPRVGPLKSSISCLSVRCPHASSRITICWQSVKSIFEPFKRKDKHSVLSREETKHTCFHDIFIDCSSKILLAIHRNQFL